MTSAKPYHIAKRVVWEAYQLVRANRGAAGVDDETIATFEQNLSGNLYKLWNRMSSGSYYPPPVRQVEIPKAKGGTRKLGVPTVSDRIAQTVAKLMIEPTLDSIFHEDSYGYRLGRSAKQAIAVTRKRCWQYDWVVEFDIKAAFDQIDHALLMKAVRNHIREDWILLYIERWLVAPFETADGVSLPRTRGTPQGGVVMPIPSKLQPWFEARQRLRLSHTHILMARELGLNPRKFGSLATGQQEPWKRPLGEFIAHCYSKRFRRTAPEHVQSLEEVVKRAEGRRSERRERKANRAVPLTEPQRSDDGSSEKRPDLYGRGGE